MTKNNKIIADCETTEPRTKIVQKDGGIEVSCADPGYEIM